jgi:hypothetical protein
VCGSRSASTKTGRCQVEPAGGEFAGDSLPCLANFLQDGIGSRPAAFQSRHNGVNKPFTAYQPEDREHETHSVRRGGSYGYRPFNAQLGPADQPGRERRRYAGSQSWGPGLTPYTTPPGQAARPYTPPPAPTTTAPPASTSPYGTNESPPATPPSYASRRHARTYHGRTGSHPGRGYSTADNSADQLNQSEFGKLQAAGNYSNPPTSGHRPPPQPGYAPPPGYPPPQPGYAPPPGYPPPMLPGYPMGTTGGGAPYRP